MKPSFILFLKRLYGDSFNREFGKEGPGINFNRIPVYSLEKLIKLFNVYQGRNCNVYTSVYTYDPGKPIPMKKPAPRYIYPYNKNVILDRIFIDFDKDLTDKAQTEYNNLLLDSSRQDFYQRLIEQGQAKAPINEAKTVYEYIVKSFQGNPTLIFSGAKGCHLYIHFNPVKLQHPKETILHFVNKLEELLNLKHMDDAVKGDFSRVSRIPTSKHPKTDLYAHPWKVDYSYNEIIENSKNKNIPFDTLDLEAARSNLTDLLYNIDSYFESQKERLKYESILRKHTRKNIVSSRDKVKIEAPEDILLLNQFPCFQALPYTHDSRVILALICLWMGLDPGSTVEALKIFAEDKGYYNPSKHLNDIRQIKSLKKYPFTCNSMKKHKLCKCKDGFCKNWFYLKLDLPDEFYKLIENYHE